MAYSDENIHTKPHLTFRLGDRYYTCDIIDIQEIVRGPELDPCLDGPELLIGLFDGSRGPVPVLDLLGRPPDLCPVRDMWLLILEVSDSTISLIVDELLDVVEMDLESLVPLPDGANGAPDELLRGVIEVGVRDYYLLDLDRIAGACVGGWIGEEAGTGDGATDQ